MTLMAAKSFIESLLAWEQSKKEQSVVTSFTQTKNLCVVLDLKDSQRWTFKLA